MTKLLSEQIDETERLAKPRGDSLQVSRVCGEVLAAIALSARAKLIVEVGTSYGFSGLFWSAALAVNGGHLHTIDISEKKFAAARETFAKAGVAEHVTGHLGDAREILAKISGVIDVAFIDADKPNSQVYFDLIWPKVRIGGCVVTDNVTSHQAEMAEYVARLEARKDACSVLVPVGSGMEWTVRTP